MFTFRRMTNHFAVAITLHTLISLETTAKGAVSPEIRTDTSDFCPNGWKFFDFVYSTEDKKSYPRCVKPALEWVDNNDNPREIDYPDKPTPDWDEAQNTCNIIHLPVNYCGFVYPLCGLFGYASSAYGDWDKDVADKLPQLDHYTSSTGFPDGNAYWIWGHEWGYPYSFDYGTIAGNGCNYRIQGSNSGNNRGLTYNTFDCSDGRMNGFVCSFLNIDNITQWDYFY